MTNQEIRQAVASDQYRPSVGIVLLNKDVPELAVSFKRQLYPDVIGGILNDLSGPAP